MRPTCVDGARLGCAVLSAPKAGATEAEYEDAWSAPGGDAPAGRGCTVAVADGASESMLAGAWASRLARAVGGLAGQDLDGAVLAERICAAAARWPGYVNRYVRWRERAGRPIAWYEDSKLEQGAYATVLGVSFRRETGPEDQPGTRAETVASAGAGSWSAAALGDACGFQVRGDLLVAAFPLESSADFDTSPDLAGTRAPDRDLLELRTVVRRGTWLPGDLFYLATDAAAQWFLADAERGGRPWQRIDEALDVGGLAAAEAGAEAAPHAWIDGLRADRLMRNDDVTIMRCRLEPERAAR